MSLELKTDGQDGLLSRDRSDETDHWKHAPSREVTGDEGGSANVRRAAERHLAENAPAGDPRRQEGPLVLLSPGFEDGGWLPVAHGAEDGPAAPISPPLRWTGLPAGTLSLVISFEATDPPGEGRRDGHPRGEEHPGREAGELLWLMVNVPPYPPMLPAGAGAGGAAERAYPERPGELVVPYRAPKAEGPERTYAFVLRALSRPVDSVSLKDVEKLGGLAQLLAANGAELLGMATLVVRYGQPSVVSSVMM